MPRLLTPQAEFQRYIKITNSPKATATLTVLQTAQNHSPSANSSTASSFAASPISQAASPAQYSVATRRFSYPPKPIAPPAKQNVQTTKSAQPSPTLAPAQSVRRLNPLMLPSGSNNGEATKSTLETNTAMTIINAMFKNIFTKNNQKTSPATSPCETNCPPSPNANSSEVIDSNGCDLAFEELELPPPATLAIS